MMRALLMFLAVFGGLLAVGGIAIGIGKGLYALSKWVDKKTGNATLAYTLVPVLFGVFLMSVSITWAILASTVTAKP